MNKVVIIVPHHKAEFSKNEIISLEQLNRVLGKYPIFVVAPKQLEGKISLFDWENIFVSDDSFGSTERYSRTFMSEWIYKMFDKYEYMMIYHTDAFVFSDKLMEFCSLGYDYIGAPWNSYDPLTRKLGIRVGNGGFCIKKIESVLKVLERKDEILEGHPLKEKMEKIEDIFFAYCGEKKDLQFSVPSIEIASTFAVEHSVNGSIENLKNKMPFGCHDWFRLNYDVWKPFIEKYGYTPDPSNKQGDEIDYKYFCLMSYLKEEMDNSHIGDVLIDATKELPHKLAIWGYGEYGRIFEKILKLACKEVIIFDKKVYLPSKDELKKQLIIITSKKYNDEISEELSDMGLLKEKDYITLDVFVEKLLHRLFPEG